MRYSFQSDAEELISTIEHPQQLPPSYNPRDRHPSLGPRLSMSKSDAAPEYVMRDDERYPTPVEEHPGLHPYTPPNPPTSAAIDDIVSPVTVVSPLSRNQTNLEDFQKLELEVGQKTRTPRRKCCGIRLSIFLALLAGLAVILIIGIMVGVVEGLKLKREAETSRLPALVASGVYIGTNDTKWNSQIAYSNTTSGKVTFLLNSGENNFTSPQTMNLTMVPASNAPMSIVSMYGTDGNIYLSLFYIYDSSIVLANVSCSLSVCTTIYNGAISKDITYPIYKTSGLAAVYLGSSGYRVFYHNTDRYLTELSTLGDGTWDHGTTIAGKAVAGSSISATEIGTSGMMAVLYVDDKSEDLYYIQYNATWQGSTAINATMSKWSALTDFTSCWQPDSDTLFAYFTGSDKLIYQLDATNASTSGMSPLDWSSTTTHDLTWIPSDSMRAGIGAIAWDNEVRFYRLVGGQLAQSAQINGIWSAKYI